MIFSPEGEAPTPKFSKTEMDEGAKLVEEFLQAWVAGNTPTTDGEDAVMQDAEASTGGGGDEDARRIKNLEETYARYKSKLEANPWCQEIMQSL